MGSKRLGTLLVAALAATMLAPAPAPADHLVLSGSVEATLTGTSNIDAKLRVNVRVECADAAGAAPGTFIGSLHLVDRSTGAERLLGDVATRRERIKTTEPLTQEPRTVYPLLRVECFEGSAHSTGPVEMTGPDVILPAKGSDPGGPGDGDGGGGGGAPEPGSPEDPLAPGGCEVELDGGRRDDVLEGGAEGDLIYGLEGDDRIRGLGGHDCLIGGQNDDRLKGGEGADRLVGEGGNDRLAGGPRRNAYDGGPGRDRIRARNGVDETVRCGSGSDVVVVDPGDKVRGCETVDG